MNCNNREQRRQLREVCILQRKMYKRAVNRAKKKFDEKRYDNLEGLMTNSKKWWKALRKYGVAGRSGKVKTVSKVVNEFEEVKEGEEAVDVWKSHFEKVMNCEGGGGKSVKGSRIMASQLVNSE